MKVYIKPKGKKLVFVSVETGLQYLNISFTNMEKMKEYAVKNEIEIIPDQLSLF